MLQFGLLALAVICGTSSAAYSSSSGAGAGAGSFAGSFGGGAPGGGVYGNTVQNSGNYGQKYPYPNNGAFYGTTGTYNQAGFQGGFPQQPFPQQQFPFAQPPQFAAPAQYNQFVTDFWKQFGQNFQNAATMTFATPGSHAYAFASAAPNAYSYDLYNQQLAHQSALFSQFGAGGAGAGGFGGAYGGNAGGNGGYGGAPNGFYAPNFAGSSASYGPQGVHQTAAIIPANPNSPNVDNRFGGDTQPSVSVSSGPGGFHGVSTSSFSSSSDINGQKTNHREASTSVNDNGKVTTYTVRS